MLDSRLSCITCFKPGFGSYSAANHVVFLHHLPGITLFCQLHDKYRFFSVAHRTSAPNSHPVASEGHSKLVKRVLRMSHSIDIFLFIAVLGIIFLHLCVTANFRCGRFISALRCKRFHWMGIHTFLHDRVNLIHWADVWYIRRSWSYSDIIVLQSEFGSSPEGRYRLTSLWLANLFLAHGYLFPPLHSSPRLRFSQWHSPLLSLASFRGSSVFPANFFVF
jgi:hypothetical protein